MLRLRPDDKSVELKDSCSLVAERWAGPWAPGSSGKRFASINWWTRTMLENPQRWLSPQSGRVDQTVESIERWKEQLDDGSQANHGCLQGMPKATATNIEDTAESSKWWEGYRARDSARTTVAVAVEDVKRWAAWTQDLGAKRARDAEQTTRRCARQTLDGVHRKPEWTPSEG